MHNWIHIPNPKETIGGQTIEGHPSSRSDWAALPFQNARKQGQLSLSYHPRATRYSPTTNLKKFADAVALSQAQTRVWLRAVQDIKQHISELSRYECLFPTSSDRRANTERERNGRWGDDSDDEDHERYDHRYSFPPPVVKVVGSFCTQTTIQMYSDIDIFLAFPAKQELLVLMAEDQHMGNVMAFFGVSTIL